MRRKCECPYPHRCRYCLKEAPCDANYCSSLCYRNDAAGNFRPLGPQDLAPADRTCRKPDLPEPEKAR